MNGKCQADGSKWTVNHGETCIVQTCEKVITGTDVTFEIKDGSPGMSPQVSSYLVDKIQTKLIIIINKILFDLS